MIIKLKEEEGLSHLVSKLKALPEEKRKVIVLVGRHRNEGTHLIARRHHKEWEEHGAVVIQIPRKWTPETFWSRLLRGKHPLSKAYFTYMSGPKYSYVANVGREKLEEKIKKSYKSDNEIIDYLTQKGFNVPFINFHGTVARSVPFDNTYAVHTDNNLPRIDGVDRDNGNRPNELLIENYFMGKENKRRKHVNNINRNLDIGQMDANYLRNDRLNLSSIDSFTKRDHTNFLDILKQLAQKGLIKK